MKRHLFLLCLFTFLFPVMVSAEKSIPMLIYHSIDQYSGHGMKELYVSPEQFETQMLYLREHGFTPLTFENWEQQYTVNKPIFLTFDDGYKNNLNVYTIFKKIQTNKFKPSGTFFVISDFIDRPNRLSKADLKKLADSGMISIQSHTATHPDLTKITDFIHELKDSKGNIEKITGKPVIAVSYPYGNFNDRTIKETKKYYLFGMTTTPGPYVKSGSSEEHYLLPRTYIKNSTRLEDFIKIVEGPNGYH
ncbi:polysaccharide deacetylase family protein [Bacillus sp. JJ1764]|uniref:polysaccharide deacetylase family protein n=1 Tax=Bacillus sp. JJ1764 TaxID=3122964 RepID=UPI002FFF9C73